MLVVTVYHSVPLPEKFDIHMRVTIRYHFREVDGAEMDPSDVHAQYVESKDGDVAVRVDIRGEGSDARTEGCKELSRWIGQDIRALFGGILEPTVGISISAGAATGWWRSSAAHGA